MNASNAALTETFLQLEEGPKSDGPCQGCQNLMRMLDDRDRMMGQALTLAKRLGEETAENRERGAYWVVDQMTRALFGDDNEALMAWANL